MLEEIDKVKNTLREGFVIPITLLVNVQFATEGDRQLFGDITRAAFANGAVPEVPVVEIESPEIESKEPEVPVNVEENTIEETEENPDKDLEIWQTEKVKYTKVANEKTLRYGEIGDVLVVKDEKMRFVTSWSEIDRLSKLDNPQLNKAILTGKYARISQKSVIKIVKFLNYYRRGVVGISTTRQPVDMQHQPVDEVVKPAEKPKEKPKDLSFTVLKGDKDLSYKTTKDNLIISYKGKIINTTWNKIIRFADLDDSKIMIELQNTRNGKDGEIVSGILNFVSAYRAGKVRDPDAGIRPMLGTNTRTQYAGYGGHVTGTLEEGDTPEE
jgi:hypothetical protein